MLKIQSATVVSQNITIVYDAIDLPAIDRQQLKSFVPKVTPAIIDLPDMLVVAYMPIPLIIQFAGQRVRVTLQGDPRPVGEAPLWETALRCHSLVSKHQLTAYGFNYDVDVQFEGSIDSAGPLGAIEIDRAAFSGIVDGQLVFIPRVQFMHEDVVYDLVVDQVTDRRCLLHMNAHFERNIIPDQDGLRTAFLAQYAYLEEVWPRLLGVTQDASH